MNGRIVNHNATVQVGASPTNEENDEPTKAAETPFAEREFPSGRVNFPAREVAPILSISVSHIWNLIKDGEIIVPQENIDRAASRASIMIPRESIVDFARRRTTRGPRRLQKAKENEAKRNAAQGSAATASQKGTARR